MGKNTKRKTKKDLNKIRRTIRVTEKTARDLEILAHIGDTKSPGRVVDKLVRDKMRYLKKTNGDTKKERGEI